MHRYQVWFKGELEPFATFEMGHEAEWYVDSRFGDESDVEIVDSRRKTVPMVAEMRQRSQMAGGGYDVFINGVLHPEIEVRARG